LGKEKKKMSHICKKKETGAYVRLKQILGPKKRAAAGVLRKKNGQASIRKKKEKPEPSYHPGEWHFVVCLGGKKTAPCKSLGGGGGVAIKEDWVFLL